MDEIEDISAVTTTMARKGRTRQRIVPDLTMNDTPVQRGAAVPNGGAETFSTTNSGFPLGVDMMVGGRLTEGGLRPGKRRPNLLCEVTNATFTDFLLATARRTDQQKA